MRSIQQKLMLYVVIIGVVPMMFFTFYYYNISRNSLYNRLENESGNILEQFDNKLTVKLNRIQNTVDILLSDRELCQILKELEGDLESAQIMQSKSDDIYERFLRGEKELIALLIFPMNGGMYVSGDTSFSDDPKNFLMQYDNSRMNTGMLTWMGLKDQADVYEKEFLVAGTSVRDTTYMKDERYLATVYMIFDDFLFAGNGMVTNSLEDGSHEAENLYDLINVAENISIYDENINLIYTVGKKSLSEAFVSLRKQESYDSLMNNMDSFTTESDGQKYMVSSYTSPITGWKFVRTFSYDNYSSPLKIIIYITILSFIVLLALWYVVNRLVVKRMTLPIRELLDAMMQVKKKNFDVEVKVKAGNDFTIINEGFNSMVQCVKELFERVHIEEKRRREQDILLLQYQMNPHFLYNTIGMVRGLALVNKQHEIAKMLLILSRFLRNAILSTQEMLSVSEEIENIKDYVSLHQLRYCNQLNFSIDAEESCMNLRIPSMLCQPIIENSLLHGMHDKIFNGETGTVKIQIMEKDEALLISIYDDGCGIPEEKIKTLFEAEPNTGQADKSLEKRAERAHIGLKNTQRRINLIFGPQYGVEVESKEGQYTLVKIKLPKIEKIQRRDDFETD